MALICLEFDEEDRERGERLLQAWGVPRCDAGCAPGVKAVLLHGRLGLSFTHDPRVKPLFLDFNSLSWKTRFKKGLTANHIFRRALGVKDEPLNVIDATAGFGEDALTILSLGCAVTALERSPVVAEVLRDGLSAARREDPWLESELKRLQIVESDAVKHLSSHPRSADVVYLDPMFEKPKKTAKSPKAMQLLQSLLSDHSPTADDVLFEAAWTAARARVVVKRPLKAKALKAAPTHSFKGQSIRYDVYVKS